VSVTDMNSMFTGCTSLTSVPSFNTAAVQNMSTMFNNCPVLRSVNFSQTGAGTLTGKFSSAFVTCSSLSRCRLGLAEYSLNFTNCNLSRSSIEEVFVEADTIGAASQIITITNNPGARAPAVIATSSAVGNGATVIPLTTTIGLEIGMQFTATVSPINVGRPVTFTDAGDIVALAAPAVGAAHGLQNGDMISFSTTTAGIVANRIYYVVGAATNTFQIAATLGGPAINITSGSSNVRYSSTITAIGPGLQVTISRPTPALTSGASLSFRQLQTAIAIHKGWAVTG
jgi:surface protein